MGCAPRARLCARPLTLSPQSTPGASGPFYGGESAAAQTGRAGFSLRPAAPQVPRARSIIPPPGFTPFSTQPSTRGHPFPASSFLHLSAPCGLGSPHQGTAQPGFAEGSLLCWASSLPPSPSSPTPGQNQTPPNTQPLPLAAPKSLGPASTLPSAWPRRRAEGLWSPSPYRFLAFCRCIFFFFLISQDFSSYSKKQRQENPVLTSRLLSCSAQPKFTEELCPTLHPSLGSPPHWLPPLAEGLLDFLLTLFGGLFPEATSSGRSS